MSLSIFEHREGRFHLFHGDREVGWVEGRAIGFSGFVTKEAARRAATVAYDALSAWLARQRRTEAAPRAGRRLGMRASGDEHLLTLGGAAIGRLLRTDSHGGAHAFELTLPPHFGASLAAAQVADNALGRHRSLSALETVPGTDAEDAVA